VKNAFHIFLYIARTALERLKSRFSGRYAVVSFVLLTVILVIFAQSLKTEHTTPQQQALLETLPDFERGYPAAIVTTVKGEFPQDLVRLLTSGTAPSPEKIPAATAFMPIFDTAESMALVVTARESGAVIYGVFTPTLEEYDSLRSGVLPDNWKNNFSAPVIRPTDRRGLYQFNAESMASPVYVMAEDDLVFVTDSVLDVNRLMDVRNGVAGGIKRKWSIDSDTGGHAYLSDGGLISSMIRGSGASPNPKESLELEVAWITSGDVNATHAKWQVSGTENVVARMFLNDLRPNDWSTNDVFVPDPLVLSFGINLPNPGRSMSNLPSPLNYLAEQMRKLKLRNADIQAILTGKATFTLGGRTQLMWFDLPGLAIDLPGRGDVAFKLIDKFWKEMPGAEPSLVPGYSHGGITEIPFTILAAANDEKAILGLIQPDTEQNYDVRDLLSKSTAVTAWIYIDFPRLGASLLEIPALNSMIYEAEEESPLDEESADSLNNALSALGRVFVTFESATSGSAICYY
jgi:hypothetical protein